MEKKELAEQLRIAAEILETGKEWEVQTATGDWVCDYYESPLFWINSGRPIRIKPWSLPEPPEGEKWHRASEWKEDMLDAGERPLLKGEEIREDDIFMEENGRQGNFTAVSYSREADESYLPLKTSRQLPQKKMKKIVPLGPEDVPPLSVIRHVTADEMLWVNPSEIHFKGIGFILWDLKAKDVEHIFRTWEELKESYLIKRPTDADFVTAHKEIEE